MSACLAVEVAGIAGIGLQLLGDRGRQAAQLRPHLAEPRQVDLGMAQQIARRSAGPRPGLTAQPVAREHGRRRGEPAEQRPAGRQRRQLPGQSLRPARPDQAHCRTLRGQTLIGIVGSQRQPVFGPRGEHAIGLAGARA
jgi:hypothetical protein